MSLPKAEEQNGSQSAKRATKPRAGKKAADPVRRRGEQQRAIEAREKIIDAAEQEFAQRGFEGSSTREIAKKAGVQHTMIRYYFTSKDGLWQAVLDRLIRDFTTRQKARCEGLRGVDSRVKLRLLLEEFVRYSAANLNLHKLMTKAAAESTPQLDRLVTEYLADYFGMIAELIAEAQARGSFVTGDPNYLHYLFIGAATRIFMQSPEVEHVLGQSPLDPAFIDMHVDKCLELFFRD